MTVRQFTFKGQPFVVSCLETAPSHPTWFTFIDEAEVRNAHWNIEPGDCVLDVGAAFGSYALTALAAGAAHVFAWCPQGMPGECSEIDMLSRSLRENNWRTRATLYDWGVYNRAGWLNAASQAFMFDEPTKPWPADVLRVLTLDEWYTLDFLKNHWREQFARYWLKMDIEGGEVEALQGGREMIAALKPKMLIELHRFKRPNVEQEVLAVLEPMGYRMTSNTAYHAVSHATYEPAAP